MSAAIAAQAWTQDQLRPLILIRLRGAGWVPLPALVRWAATLGIDEQRLACGLRGLRDAGLIERRFRPAEGRWSRIAEYRLARRRSAR